MRRMLQGLLFVGGISVLAADTDKTLVSWVTLKDKKIRGGSALTVQEGDQFDGIVFAELAEGRWMAGSDYHRRTQKEQDAYPAETAADGNGPVDALNHALRIALEDTYPELRQVHLEDYKVRIIDAQSATAAKTRVLIESTDGDRAWDTVGVSENIIAASYRALVDSIEYKLVHGRVLKADA